MSVSSPLETMFWLILICTLQSMFHITRGCVAEERIALLRIRSLLIEANQRVPASLGQYEVPASWGAERRLLRPCSAGCRKNG